MRFADISIQRKLMFVIFIISGIILFVTCTIFSVYEFYSFRQATVEKLSTIGDIISANSTAALAFENSEDAKEILSTLKAEPHIVAACLFNKKGKKLVEYAKGDGGGLIPLNPREKGHRFSPNYLEDFRPIMQGDNFLGTLYLRSDLEIMYQHLRLYGIITILVICFSFFIAYLLSLKLQKSISRPILTLAKTAGIISDKRNYSLRAVKSGNDEIGSLTDSFNLMLEQIHLRDENLKGFNQKLEQKVYERTVELETANKDMEAFTYTVSHDLRAPLRAIDGFMRLFSERYSEGLDEEAKRFIEIVSSNAIKMKNLIDDLLSFSHLSRKELRKVRVSMKNIVEEVWDEQLKMEQERDIEFIIDDLPEAYADNSIIKQVWVNLISNALKYSRHNAKTIIRISFEKQKDNIVYSIQDNGSGFDMKYYDKLFGVFQRLHSQEEYEGTGVGLAIVQRIIEKHGGKVWAESKIDQGTTFYFSLSKEAF